jgi:hypothetical protein
MRWHAPTTNRKRYSGGFLIKQVLPVLVFQRTLYLNRLTGH